MQVCCWIIVLQIIVDSCGEHLGGRTGLAKFVLERAAGLIPGQVAFGDQTNDTFGGPYVNSTFQVDFIEFEALNAIPEPSTYALMAMAMVMAAIGLRRQSAVSLA